MPCYRPIKLKKLDERHRTVIVPCGRCIGCLLERSRQHAVRCMNEAQMHEENSFLTLTLNDDNLIYGHEEATLYPRHLQLFFKKYRKYLDGKPIRYFACGEYGDVTRRPHYHALIFGHDFTDKQLYSQKNGNYIYTSKLLDNIWGHGECKIGALTFESAAYVSRYIVGKKLGEKKEGVEPEFVRMSRRPGIGKSWYEKFKKDIYPSDLQIVRGKKCKPPRYYDKKHEENSPLEMELIKQLRIKESELNPDKFNIKRLHVKETVKKAQIKQLKRNYN